MNTRNPWAGGMAAVAAAAAMAVGSGCGRRDAAGPAAGGGAAAHTYRVSVVPVAARPLSYAVETTGSVEACQVLTIAARVDGAVERVDFDEGDRVTPETVLAVIDGEKFRLQADRARALEARAEAAARAAKAGRQRAAAALAEAQAGLARREALRERNAGWVSAEERDAKRTAVAELSAALDQAAAAEQEADAARDEAQAARALAEKSVADAHVRSPIPGVIDGKFVVPGQYLKAGQPVAVLTDTSSLRLRFRVTEAESARIAAGQKVRFRVAALPGRDLEAEVFHVDAAADAATRTVECLARVADPPPGLRPGFFAEVRVEIGRSEAAVVVPESAILPTERGFVAFVAEQGKARRRVLQLGLHTRDGGVEVLDGLRAGELLVVRGAPTLEDGFAVEVVADDGTPERERQHGNDGPEK